MFSSELKWRFFGDSVERIPKESPVSTTHTGAMSTNQKLPNFIKFTFTEQAQA